MFKTIKVYRANLLNLIVHTRNFPRITITVTTGEFALATCYLQEQTPSAFSLW